jgi:anthranilate synthase/aminodeoxychorismate synthase-like glutamine amidotransferase
MILIIDNYDSFVHNVASYFVELGQAVRVVRNDAVTKADLAARAIVISPGPCTPQEAGVSLDILREKSGRLPILGICLGHQCIGAGTAAHAWRQFRHPP